MNGPRGKSSSRARGSSSSSARYSQPEVGASTVARQRDHVVSAKQLIPVSTPEHCHMRALPHRLTGQANEAGLRSGVTGSPAHHRQLLTGLGERFLELDRGVHGGAPQIEGRHYCPGMSAALKNASVDAEAGNIHRETYLQRIETRRAFELRAKERPDPKGRQPMMCPALGPQARVVCPLRERYPNSSRKPKESVKPRDVPQAIGGELPAICCQSSVSLGPDEGLKYKQELVYGSLECEATYHRDRNLSEGYHSFIKDTSYEAFEVRGERRMRGLAAQQFLGTFLVVSANLRALFTFVEDEYLREAHGVEKKRAPHLSAYSRIWFKKADELDDPPEPETIART